MGEAMEPTPNAPDRRRFLKNAGATAGIAAAHGFAWSRPASGASPGPNGRIGIGLIGPGGMGMNHLRTLLQNDEVAVTFVCDPDAGRLAAASKLVEEATGTKPAAAADLRRLLESPDVDAVFIATPDHWHAPATLLACAAGKHAYVEKPCSHNLREGRLMIEAARRHGTIVQMGTQSRSTGHVREAVERLRNGAIGDILGARVWNSQLRRSIGHAEPSPPPPHLDFDLWTGPAPATEYRSNLLHSSWRWWRAFGCGDIGNDGVHDLDIARWGLGVDRHPVKVASMGGKFFFDDDQEWPDTQTVLFEYAPDAGTGRPRQLIYEQRLWSPYVQEGHENGDAFFGTDGFMILGKGGGWKLFGPRNELREERSGRPDLAAHHRNFLDAVRSGDAGLLNAEIATGHLSSSLCHLGNIAVQTGRSFTFDPDRERIPDDPEADALLHREYRDHWAAPTPS